METKSMLTDNEKRSFSRQIVLPRFGERGQQKLRETRVMIAGIGGLGAFSSLLLAEMGIGYLRIVDRDLVERTNLHRSPLYTEEDLDLAKVEAASLRLQRINPSLVIDTHASHINEGNIEDLLEGIDIVIDGLDNFETRRIINAECVKRKIPFVFCGVSGRIGNLAVFNSNNKSPCLSCLYHEVNDKDLESCDITGIHPALLAVVTGLQVHETVDLLLHGNSTLDGTLLFIDLQNMSFNKIPLQKNENCHICSTIESKTISQQLADYKSLELCGDNTVMVVPTKKVQFNFQQALDSISTDFSILKKGKFAFTFQFSEDVVITIFRGGNALIRGLNSRESALVLWEEFKENKF
jgi:molybdopterin/thiamine biosynthesis adenylyltransferase